MDDVGRGVQPWPRVSRLTPIKVLEIPTVSGEARKEVTGGAPTPKPQPLGALCPRCLSPPEGSMCESSPWRTWGQIPNGKNAIRMPFRTVRWNRNA
jgi:hypothetical protein